MNFIVKANSSVIQICDVISNFVDTDELLIYDREINRCYLISNDDDKFHDCTEYDYELATSTMHDYDIKRDIAVRHYWNLQKYLYNGDY